MPEQVQGWLRFYRSSLKKLMFFGQESDPASRRRGTAHGETPYVFSLFFAPFLSASDRRAAFISSSRFVLDSVSSLSRQHFLYFLPLPHRHWSFLPNFDMKNGSFLRISTGKVIADVYLRTLEDRHPACHLNSNRSRRQDAYAG